MANLTQSMIKTERNMSDGFFDESEQGTTPFVVGLFLLIVATVMSNSAVFFAVYTIRGLRTVTNCFVISLASADLAVALISMPLWLLKTLLHLNKDDKRVLDMGIHWVDIFCCSASIFSATLVSIDRYLAINKPLRYREMVTRRRANRSIAGVWLLAFIEAATLYIQFINIDCIYGSAIFVFVSILCIPFTIMCFSYISIYRAAVAQLSKMAYNGYTSSIGEAEKKRYLVSERRKRFYKELRITKTLAITVSLFFIAWAPFLVMILIETFYPDYILPVWFLMIANFFPFINSFANPLIYTGFNKDFRKALKKLLCSPNPLRHCIPKNATERGIRVQSASRSLVGSLQGDDTAITSLNRASSSGRRLEVQCTTV